MTVRQISWPDRIRSWVGSCLSEPLYRLFSLVPDLEVGLGQHEVTTITQVHGPLAGRRAVHLTDLHLDRYQPRHDRIVEAVQELSPDWIFITGDLLNVPEGLPHLFRFLANLRSVAPVFVTLGNHDHYSGVPPSDFSRLADRHGITLLVNQTAYIPTGVGELAIAGVDDPSLHRADLSCVPPPAHRRFTLLLAHAPNILDQLREHHAVDLVLCGHSHGGQWRFPGIPTFWLPPGCNGRIAGKHETSRHRLYINRGIGWSFMPFRYRCKPEIGVIDWVNEQAGARAA
ncbi:putative Metallophosphoesterase [Nitrospira japonica]|uniref:Putative Metallophosphoesterase n=1 Tax=Nitrospira japonica TaxID=1325564 RepID=A0A1W1I4D7_9BACT|nr:metallophosphoesterase [Nitrospira japonica]SLM47739.1 putative Metallophosphoesterase [Nitrospira japonica]